MQHKDAFWVTLLLFYCQAETSAEQLNGVLGESVTFQTNESKPFASISWYRIEKNGRFRTLALVAPGKPCKLLIPLQAFKERISSTSDCRNLQLSHLGKEDSNRYTANFVFKTSKSIDEHFDLKVYKRFQNTDLSIKCKIKNVQKKLLQLTCSVGKWKDQLDLHLFVEGESNSQDSHEGLLLINYTNQKVFDQKVSCKAENPVSKVYRTMMLREACPKLQRYASREELVTRFVVGSLSLFCGLTILFAVWLIKCPIRHHLIPGTTSDRAAEASQPNPETHLPPP